MDDKKIVLFATTQIDAVKYCEVNGLDFSKIIWVMNYQLLGSTGFTDVDEIQYTELFKLMPAYMEAKAVWAREKETPVE